MATALYSFAGLNGIIIIDIGSFIVAFTALLFFINIPENKSNTGESALKLAKENPLIMSLILFMSGVNLAASAFNAVLPCYVLSNPKGSSYILGIVTSCPGNQCYGVPASLPGGFLCQLWMRSKTVFMLGVTGSLICIIMGRKLKKYHNI